jgi:hypothetical protein
VGDPSAGVGAAGHERASRSKTTRARISQDVSRSNTVKG